MKNNSNSQENSVQNTENQVFNDKNETVKVTKKIINCSIVSKIA